jgi:hypothetical protein
MVFEVMNKRKTESLKKAQQVCISQIRRQKTNLKSRPHTLRVIQQYSSEEYWNHPTRKNPLENKHNNNVVLNDL